MQAFGKKVLVVMQKKLLRFLHMSHLLLFYLIRILVGFSLAMLWAENAVVKKWSARQKNVRLLAYVQDMYYICDSNNKQKQRHMKSLLIVIAAIIVTIMIFGIALFFCEVLKALIKAIMEEEEYSEFKSTISKGEL